MQKINHKHQMILFILLASYSMLVIDNSIVITGLPTIQSQLTFTPEKLSWVQNAYMLCFGGFMLLGARAGDIFGSLKVFLLGLLVFTLSSLVISLSNSANLLIGARAIQGLGAAVLSPATLTLLTKNFSEGAERNRAISWYGAIGGITASLGLVAGGIIANFISWRAGFFINVPIGLFLMLTAPKYITETDRHNGKLDITGAILSTISMICLVYGLIQAAESGFGNAYTSVLFFIFVLSLLLFIQLERKIDSPLLPLRIFLSKERSGAYIARILFTGSAMGFFFYTTQYLQSILHMNAFQAGIAFFPSMIVNFLGALLAPRLSKRFSHSTVLLGAIVISFIGMLLLGFGMATSSFWFGVMVPMILVGSCMGAAMALLTVLGVSKVSHQDAGAASGVVGVAHQVGGAFGIALLVLVSSLSSHSSNNLLNVQQQGMCNAMFAGATLLAICFITVFSLNRK
ncbi:MAG: MFS transporter [Tolumonas sp.]|nr:MFS transporter [Tolumonas sp.]